jgi:hypothetical protein
MSIGVAGGDNQLRDEYLFGLLEELRWDKLILLAVGSKIKTVEAVVVRERETVTAISQMSFADTLDCLCGFDFAYDAVGCLSLDLLPCGGLRKRGVFGAARFGDLLEEEDEVNVGCLVNVGLMLQNSNRRAVIDKLVEAVVYKGVGKRYVLGELKEIEVRSRDAWVTGFAQWCRGLSSEAVRVFEVPVEEDITEMEGVLRKVLLDGDCPEERFMALSRAEWSALKRGVLNPLNGNEFSEMSRLFMGVLFDLRLSAMVAVFYRIKMGVLGKIQHHLRPEVLSLFRNFSFLDMTEAWLVPSVFVSVELTVRYVEEFYMRYAGCLVVPKGIVG